MERLERLADCIPFRSYFAPFGLGYEYELAPSNMKFMSVTFEVSHLPIGWLKDLAPRNVANIFVTFEVSKSPIDWLKDSA